jgi:NAD(P)-dependent dehydrogenase (short-subunit alcohol dehydrogenase family)
MKRTIVVTGTSTGIGYATALRAARAGWRVLATVRDPHASHTRSASAALEESGCAVVSLDLRDERSLTELAAEAEAWCGGRLDALVNNAGSALPGAVEELEMAAVRDQFEVNVFGHVAVTQRLLPALRTARGRVLFISSNRTRVPVPLYGAYVASKCALEGFAAALGAEVEPLGVAVSVLELGSFESAIRETIRPGLEEIGPSSPYAAAARTSLARLGAPPLGDPDEVARTILELLEADHPPARAILEPAV